MDLYAVMAGSPPASSLRTLDNRILSRVVARATCSGMHVTEQSDAHLVLRCEAREPPEEALRLLYADEGGRVETTTIRAAEGVATRRNTMAAVYGRSRYPLHTDGAHLPSPPRLVLLAYRRD